MTHTVEGGCACGAVRYRMMSPPMFVHCCHCHNCQRQSGTAFVLNALIEADRVSVLAGHLADIRVPTDSGQPHLVDRCRACQTALWSTYDGREVLRFIRVGTLDDTPSLASYVHIYLRSKMPWVT